MFSSAIPWYFTWVEIGAYLLAPVLLYYASKQGRYMVLTLLMAMMYGYLLEYIDMALFDAYTYGQFHVMLPGEVPLCVAMVWGMLFFAAMETSNLLGFVWYRRPWLDGLLAISLDLCMDPIATQLGYWEWKTPGPWLGIPMGNYFGWLIVITAFSYTWRMGLHWLRPLARPLWQQVLSLLAVIMSSLVILFVLLLLFNWLLVAPGYLLLQQLVVIGWLVLAFALVLPYLPKADRYHVWIWPILLLPLFLFGYLVLMVFTAVDAPSVGLIANSLATAVVGLLMFTFPYNGRWLLQRVPAG